MSSDKNSKIKTFLRIKPKIEEAKIPDSLELITSLRISKSPDFFNNPKKDNLQNLRRSCKNKPSTGLKFNNTLGKTILY